MPESGAAAHGLHSGFCIFEIYFNITLLNSGNYIMAFFNSAVGVLQTLVVALGAGLGIWGAINLLEGYAEIKALCAGDERIKEKMDLDIDVARLKLMKANHQSQQYRLEDNLLKTFPEQIDRCKGYIAGFEADLKTLAAMLIGQLQRFRCWMLDAIYG